MKKFLVMVATATLILSGCGASKKAQLAYYQQQLELERLKLEQQRVEQRRDAHKAQHQGNSHLDRDEEELDECEKMSMDFSDGTLKAYASAISPDRDFARTIATTRARAALASSISALVTNTLRTYRSSTTKGASQDIEGKDEQMVEVIAEEQMRYTAVACSKRYALSDGRYEATVCVKMMNDLADTCREAVKMSLSSEEKLRVEFDEQRFMDSFKESLSRYRQEKGY